jgi:hypothetical protein
MAGAQKKNLESPDEQVRLEGVSADVVQIGDTAISRMVFEPNAHCALGGRKLRGNHRAEESCQAHHMGPGRRGASAGGDGRRLRARSRTGRRLRHSAGARRVGRQRGSDAGGELVRRPVVAPRARVRRGRRRDAALHRHRRLGGPRLTAGRRRVARAPGSAQPRRQGSARPVPRSGDHHHRRRIPGRVRRRGPGRASGAGDPGPGPKSRHRGPSGDPHRRSGDRRRRRSGVAVHKAARVAAATGAGEVLVSQTTHQLPLGGVLEFEDRDEFELKGLDGARRLYAVLP